MYLTWNGRADGADSGNTQACTGCVQRGKDIVLPTAQNACGPLCGDATLEELRRVAVWDTNTPTSLIHAISYVKSWPERQYWMYWTGQVKLELQRDTADTQNDISGRGEFYRLFHRRNDSFVRNSYVWQRDEAVDKSMPRILNTMRNSTFCYSPLGRVGGDHDRYIPALLTGCIPVILKSVVVGHKRQHIVQPFEDIINWDSIAVLIHADEMTNLTDILSRTNIVSKRAHVHSVWRKLLYTSFYGSYLKETQEADALASLVEVLQLRLAHATST
jgi:hypothetical protein